MNGRRAIRWAMAVGVLSLLTWSCTASPSPSELQENPAYLNPAGGEIRIDFQDGDLILGSMVYHRHYRCEPGLGYWDAEALPPGDPVLLDLYFPWGYSFAVPFHFPALKAEFVDDVREVGGEVVHEFNSAVVRARVPRSSFGRFPEYGVLSHARTVPDPERFDVRLLTVFHDASRTEELKQLFRYLGGVITRESNTIPTFGGVVPDAAIPELLETGAISYVSMPRTGCALQ